MRVCLWWRLGLSSLTAGISCGLSLLWITIPFDCLNHLFIMFSRYSCFAVVTFFSLGVVFVARRHLYWSDEDERCRWCRHEVAIMHILSLMAGLCASGPLWGGDVTAANNRLIWLALIFLPATVDVVCTGRCVIIDDLTKSPVACVGDSWSDLRVRTRNSGVLCRHRQFLLSLYIISLLLHASCWMVGCVIFFLCWWELGCLHDAVGFVICSDS